jgi:hypothetical protein
MIQGAHPGAGGATGIQVAPDLGAILVGHPEQVGDRQCGERSVIKFDDDGDAVGIANDTTYGLNAFVHTRDLNRAHRVARSLQAGSVWINTFSDISPQGPYGGYKQSGFGRTGGIDGLNEFTQVKNIASP